MKLHFLGAARQVTGSMFMLELEDYKILIDCGTDMERTIDYSQPAEPSKTFFPFDASLINLLILTHAHIDHSGNIPMLYREGFEGQILCTSPTADLTEILLYDSASLNLRKLKAAQGDSRKKQKKMDNLLKKGDLYLNKDVDDAIKNFVCIQFNRKFQIIDNVWITFYPAGHLLGAAHVVLEVLEEGVTKKIGFSGDIGRKDYPLHVDPVAIPEVDYLICETTYGNRVHEDIESPIESLGRIIRETCVDKPGRLIIPAFSVGRTQAVLFTLNQLIEEHNLPSIRVFTDSPLGRSSTKIYSKYLSYLNPEAKDFAKENDSLFDFDNLVFLQTEKESEAIKNYREPCIIISSSGMISGGRVEQHIANNIENSYCTILLIGFAAEGTLGRELLGGMKTLQIKTKEYRVNAQIRKIDVFSGHADQKGLIEFVRHQNPKKLKNIFLSHGEEQSMLDFKHKLEEFGFNQVILPEKNQTFDL
ncbi:MBL fold metallo-hydrolase [Sandaracinomonas limnophila]|uniref:MBL fold metallo-hydrolase n=1 Tax=Sandaracinomonas limnophila TaxID=1862386 RepID=A0A437PWZ2_9BACT|nr:MBL fold metallo-hydrolase [Sandaracinomonas limnophila]RVU26771.1 MBL fold metallo-hydrolase [Sandaracinomonas limnophila]